VPILAAVMTIAVSMTPTVMICPVTVPMMAAGYALIKNQTAG